MITLKTIVHHRTVLKIFIMIIYEFWNLDLVPPYMLPQQINSTHVPHLSIYLASEEDAAESCEEESGLEVRVNEIHGFEISLDGGRNCVID